MKRRNILSVCLILALWATIAAAAATETTIDGVLHVRNSSEPTGGTETLVLRELWRVGGEDDETIFGLIPRVGADAAGNVYILDSQLCEVSVYSPDGEFLRMLFREGDGPGEVRRPRDMLLLGNGQVGLLQEMPAVIVFVDAEGNPSPNLSIGSDDPAAGGIASLSACDAAGGTIIISGTDHPRSEEPGIGPRINFASAFTRSGVEITRLAENHTHYDFNDFHFIEVEHMPSFWWCYAAVSDGTVYVAPDRARYEIHKFAPDGTLDRIIERDFEVVQRSEREFDDLVGIVESALNAVPVPTTVVMEKTAEAIGYLHRGLRVREDGSLWVMSSEGMRDRPEGVLVTFDVFDPDGTFVRRTALRGEGDPLRDGIFFVAPDRVAVIKGYRESLAAQFGQGTTYSGNDEEPVILEVIVYEMQ